MKLNNNKGYFIYVEIRQNQDLIPSLFVRKS